MISARKDIRKFIHNLIDSIYSVFHIGLIAACTFLCMWYPLSVPAIILGSFVCLVGGAVCEFIAHHAVNLLLGIDGNKISPNLLNEREHSTSAPHSTCKIQTTLANHAVLSPAAVPTVSARTDCSANQVKQRKGVELEGDEVSRYRVSLNM